MRSFSISFLLTGIILSVVYTNNHEPRGTFRDQLYELAQDTIALDSNNYFLEPFLCRSLSDTSAGNATNVLALIYLVDASNQHIPTSVFITNLYLVHGEEIWTSSSSAGRSAMPEFLLTTIDQLDKVWEDDGFDVIAELSDTLSQKTYYVISRNQFFSDL